jgi:hypothetical protein
MEAFFFWYLIPLLANSQELLSSKTFAKQLTKMAKNTTLFLFLLFCCSWNYSYSQIFGEEIAYWDFSDGIPADWTNTSLSGIAQWEYRGPNTDPDNTVCGRGSCGAGSLPPASQSLDNGFVIFDSNYWDDDQGPCGPGLGSGQDPGPHTAWLTTGNIDLSGENDVVLTFQQQFKHFQTSTKVEISINDGPFTTVHTNAGPFSPNVQWVTVNISAYAANQSNVKIRFAFQGLYYWWCIDDIVLYEPNDNDLVLTETAYTDFELFGPGITGLENMEYDAYPTAFIRPFDFSCSFLNVGGLTQTSVDLNVAIKNESNVTIHTATGGNINSAPGQSASISIAAEYTPPATVGKYTIDFEVEQSQTDEAPDDNLAQKDFRITNYVYARAEEFAQSFYSPAAFVQDAAFELGNIYEVKVPGYKLSSIGVAISDESVVGSRVYGRVYDLNRDVIYGTTPDYEVNSAFLNADGEKKMMYLHFDPPITLYDTGWYNVQVGAYGNDERVRICTAGVPPDFTSYLIYPDNNLLYFVRKTPMVQMHVFPANATPGCTDLNADNYLPGATVNDGSCLYYGCAIPEADNYDPTANFNDGSCILDGCTDPIADNYNPDATDNDGSCLYSGCTDPEAANYNPQANVDDASCIYPGCTDPSAANYNPQANQEDGSCIYPGCMDPEAANYNPQANQDDGSCIYPGCTNPNAVNFDPQANQDDGSCVVFGCTDPEADNYQPDANNDDGSCFYLGCMDPEADNYDATATVDDGSCLYYGCTDVEALNFDPGANFDDGSCQYDAAFLGASITMGCEPLNVTFTNQTLIAENGVCLMTINGEVYTTECIAGFDYEFMAGNYEISYTYSVDNFESTYILTIQVFPTPAAPVLSFDESTYLVSCSGCEGYGSNWFFNDVLYAENGGNEIQAPGSGTYMVDLITDQACSASSDVLNVTLETALFSVSPDAACGSLEVTVENANAGAIPASSVCTYSVNDETIHTGCESSFNYTFTIPGDYIIEYSFSVGPYISELSSDELSVYEIPVQPIITFNEIDFLIECEGCSDMENIVWYLNGDATGLTNVESFTPQENGNYQVTVTTVDGCENSSEETLLLPIGINDLINPWSINAYPVPASSFIVLDAGFQSNWDLTIYDLDGKEVHKSWNNAPGALIVNTELLPSGIYVVQARTGNIQRQLRFNVVH